MDDVVATRFVEGPSLRSISLPWYSLSLTSPAVVSITCSFATIGVWSNLVVVLVVPGVDSES
jgi:hypothetical protein